MKPPRSDVSATAPARERPEPRQESSPERRRPGASRGGSAVRRRGCDAARQSRYAAVRLNSTGADSKKRVLIRVLSGSGNGIRR